MLSNLDQVDRVIVTQLGQDGRINGKELSTLLPVDGGATRLRMQRLLESTVRVRALFDPSKVGFPVQAFLGIKVRPASTATAILRLAQFECTRYASGVVGVYDIVSVVTARSLRAFQQFLQCDVGTIDGIENIETSIYFQNETGYFVGLSPNLLREVSDPPAGLDLKDMQLMACLAEDGRRKGRDIAIELGMNEMTTQRRIKRLVENKVITIRGMVESHTLGFPVTAVIGLKASPDKIGIIAKELGGHRQMNVVTTCTGRFDVISFGIFRDNGDLDAVLNDFIRPLEGVREAAACVVLGEKRAKEAWFVPRAFADETGSVSNMARVS